MTKAAQNAIKSLIMAITLIAGNVSLSAAASIADEGCEFYGSDATSIPYPAVQALLQSLPGSSSVIVCNSTRNVQFSILDPVDSRNGVSFYRRCYHEMPADSFSKAKSAKDLLSTRHRLERTMMALDPNSELTHQSDAVVNTDSLSPGAFKTLYNVWMESIESPEKLEQHFHTSALDAAGKAQFEKFIQSLKNSAETKFTYLQFQDLRMAEGDDFDLEFFPRLVINISTTKQWWEIDFDVLDGDQYMVLNVELQMDATGAN